MKDLFNMKDLFIFAGVFLGGVYMLYSAHCTLGAMSMFRLEFLTGRTLDGHPVTDRAKSQRLARIGVQRFCFEVLLGAFLLVHAYNILTA